MKGDCPKVYPYQRPEPYSIESKTPVLNGKSKAKPNGTPYVANDFCRAINKGTEQKGERLWNLVGVVERLRNRAETDIEVGEDGGY